MTNKEKTAEKAKNKLEQLSKGKKSTNEIRAEVGLSPIENPIFNQILTKD